MPLKKIEPNTDAWELKTYGAYSHIWFANLRKCTAVEEKYNTSFAFFRTNSYHLKAKK